MGAIRGRRRCRVIGRYRRRSRSLHRTPSPTAKAADAVSCFHRASTFGASFPLSSLGPRKGPHYATAPPTLSRRKWGELKPLPSPPSAGALQGFAERAGRQHSDHVPLVLDRPAEILAGLGRLGAELGGALDGGVVWPGGLEGCLRPRGLDGCEADAGEADPDLVAGAAGADRELHGYRGRGEVADLALELEVGAAAARLRNRHADLHEDLVGLEGGRERAGEERRDGDPALALRACGDDLGAEREHRRGVVVGGIAVG